MKMKELWLALLLFPAAASAATNYSVQMELGLGSDAPLPIVMTVLENEPSILNLSTDPASTGAQDELTVEVLVKGARPTTEASVDQAEVALTIRRATGGSGARMLAEKMTIVVPLGTLSTMQLAQGGGLPGSDAIDLRLAVSKFEAKAGEDACIPQSGERQARRDCCRVGCGDGSGRTLTCCGSGGCCSACGARCCVP